jgi:hypothetical protein
MIPIEARRGQTPPRREVKRLRVADQSIVIGAGPDLEPNEIRAVGDGQRPMVQADPG